MGARTCWLLKTPQPPLTDLVLRPFRVLSPRETKTTAMSRTIASPVVLTKPPDAPGYNGYFSVGENDCEILIADVEMVC